MGISVQSWCYSFHGLGQMHFPDDTWSGASFRSCICHLHIFPGDVSVKILGPSFNHTAFLSLHSKRVFWYVLDNSCSLDVFSQFVACLVILPKLSFMEQKFVNLTKSSSPMTSFRVRAFTAVCKTASPAPRVSQLFSCAPFCEFCSLAFCVWASDPF